jgi:lysophospholipase L1-like esterase
VKNILKNAALIAAALLTGVLASEILVALFLPQKEMGINVVDPFFGRFDPEVGWVNRENAEGEHRPNLLEPGAYIRINAKGLRGKEVPYERVAGKRRILLLGDSITFGYGLDEESTYPSMLKEMLGEGYEVINAASIGYGTDQEYLFFRREGVKYRPDIVIAGFSAGDIYDVTCSMRYGTYKPFFRLEDGRLRLHNTPVPERAPLRELLGLSPVRDFLFGTSHLYRLLHYRFSDPAGILEKSREEMDRFEGVRVVVEIIREINRECAAIGCTLLFVVIPQEDWLEASVGPEKTEFFRRGHDAAVRVLGEADVTHIDLWEPFAARRAEGLFLKGDKTHPNKRGNGLIASELYNSGLL